MSTSEATPATDLDPSTDADFYVVGGLDQEYGTNPVVMDGIAVDPDMRGRGVGSLLIEEVAAVAAEQDCREIRLDVIDTNPRARALYERRGFTAVRTEHTPYLRGLLGFGAVTTMRRPVATGGTREL